MSTIYPGPNHEEFDRDGLPIRRKGSAGAQPSNPFAQTYAAADPYAAAGPFVTVQPQYPVQPGAYPPVPYAQTPYAVAPKSKIVAALLFFFLGSFGIGNFYLHQNKRGIAKLILTFVGFITAIILIGFVILAAVGFWALIETILVLVGAGGYDRDGRGVPLD